MKIMLKISSFIGLALTIFPALLVFSGVLVLDSYKTLMLIGTLQWFGSAPFWMKK